MGPRPPPTTLQPPLRAYRARRRPHGALQPPRYAPCDLFAVSADTPKPRSPFRSHRTAPLRAPRRPRGPTAFGCDFRRRPEAHSPPSAPKRPPQARQPRPGPHGTPECPAAPPQSPPRPAAPPTHPPLPALRVQISRQPPPALLIGRSFRCLSLAHPRHVIPASARGITGLVVPRRGAGGGAGGGAPSEARRRSAALPQGSLSAGGDPSRHGGTRPAMGTRSVTWPMFSHGANIPSRGRG